MMSQAFDSPEAFFEHHCSRPGAVILVEIIDARNRTLESAVFTGYKSATTWTKKFQEDDKVKACNLIPQFLDFPEFGDSSVTSH